MIIYCECGDHISLDGFYVYAHEQNDSREFVCDLCGKKYEVGIIVWEAN